MTRPHPHLYEINTVAWLLELTQREGRRVSLGTVPDREWDRLRSLGFDYVWLMGVWQRSPMGARIAQELDVLQPEYGRALPGYGRGDIVGSPYSIQYYEPDVLVGSWSELDAARESLARRGMGLVLDFVPNHTALDHPWVASHPEYYVHGTAADLERSPDSYFEVEVAGVTHVLARGKDPYFPAWTDTLQLDFFYPATRVAMSQQLADIASHCDGLRCDMAMLVLNDVFAGTWGRHRQCDAPKTEFWTEARAHSPNVTLIAEAYWGTESRLIELGFDYCYDKRLYDRARDGWTEGVREHLAAPLCHQARMVRFLENHDEPRAKAALGPRLSAASVLFSTLPGMRLFHHGQLTGRQERLPVQLIRARAEPDDREVESMYARLLAIIDHPLLHEGSFALADVGPFEAGGGEDRIVAYSWSVPGEWRACAVNLTDRWAQGRIRWTIDFPTRPLAITDLLTGETYERDGHELAAKGLHVVLAPFQSQVFAPADPTSGQR